MARLICELKEPSDRTHRSSLRRLPEYRRFIAGAATCGFVCNDIAPKYFSQYQTELKLLRKASFAIVRRYLHTLVRPERHQDPEFTDDMLPVHVALRSGAWQ